MMPELRQTYITRLPDKAGALLKASRVIGASGGNIVRVNYNKAVDAHTLFLEVEASAESHREIEQQLSALGYLADDSREPTVIFLELKIDDGIGAIQPVLEVIKSYNANVSYLSSRERARPYQRVKTGLLVDDADCVPCLIADLSKLCKVKVLDYDVTEKSLDNTVFYITFAHELQEILGLTDEERDSVIINSNRIMQLLDEKNEAPMKTFDCIKQYAELVRDQKGESFDAPVDERRLSCGMTLYTIQPPCGSNTYIIKAGRKLLFIDCGFACYKAEMMKIFEGLLGDLSQYSMDLLITHPDMDHTGLFDIFDHIYMNGSCYENYRREWAGETNFRGEHLWHAPYCDISRVISKYAPPAPEKCVVIGEKTDDEPLSHIGDFEFSGLKFELYEGCGGHLRGETVIVCESEKLVFTGDIVVNIKGFTEKQYCFNLLAPYLMKSVNIDPDKARALREMVFERYKGYTLCPGHGAIMDNE